VVKPARRRELACRAKAEYNVSIRVACYFLRKTKGHNWNHKRLYRLYRELELSLRLKPKSRLKRDKPNALAVPTEINQVWSMDFMSDSLNDGRSVRTFNSIDDCNREGLAMDFGSSLPVQRVIRSL